MTSAFNLDGVRLSMVLALPQRLPGQRFLSHCLYNVCQLSTTLVVRQIAFALRHFDQDHLEIWWRLPFDGLRTVGTIAWATLPLLLP